MDRLPVSNELANWVHTLGLPHYKPIDWSWPPPTSEDSLLAALSLVTLLDGDSGVIRTLKDNGLVKTVPHDHGWTKLGLCDDLRGDAGYRLQRIWWNYTGKTFPLMRLPLELIERILLESLGWIAYPQLYGDAKNIDRYLATHRPHIFSLTGVDRDVSRIYQHPCYSVLLLDRQTHGIVRRHLLRSFVVSCRNHYDLAIILNLWPGRAAYITRLQLSMPKLEFFSLFKAGIAPFNGRGFAHQEVPWFYGFRALTPAARHKELTGLKSLEIDFQSTFNNWSSPWNWILPDPHDHRWPFLVQARKDIQDLRLPCQRRMVQIIMAFAEPYIRHVPKIRLTGFVKHDQKEYWNKYSSLSNDFRNNMIARQAEIRAGISSTHAHELPPVCWCGFGLDIVGACPCPKGDLCFTRKVARAHYKFDHEEIRRPHPDYSEKNMKRRICGCPGCIDDIYVDFFEQCLLDGGVIIPSQGRWDAMKCLMELRWPLRPTHFIASNLNRVEAHFRASGPVRRSDLVHWNRTTGNPTLLPGLRFWSDDPSSQ